MKQLGCFKKQLSCVLSFAVLLAVSLPNSWAHESFSGPMCHFMPENDLHLDQSVKGLSNITEAQFNQTVDAVISLYQPLVKAQGANLVSSKLWNDETVNAQANQSGRNWIVTMFGGLARRPEITLDGFSMVVCHEVGHHMGGFPFYSGSWAASEGQADYFATQACAHLLWENDLAGNAAARKLAPKMVIDRCDASWKKENDRNLCYRAALAGQSLALLLSKLGGSGEPKFETPSTKVVTRTNTAHPDAQCRLDTYFNGGLCAVPFEKSIIPGKKNPAGEASVEAEQEALKYSCGGKGVAVGIRPACWFFPRI